MAEEEIDLATWDRADQFRLFRSYAKPHYAITTRLDLTHLMSRKTQLSTYRACLYAIGAGLHAVPELRTRFRGDQVVRHDSISLSMSVPRPDGSFTYAYVPYDTDFTRFDAAAKALIEIAADEPGLNAHAKARDDVAYLSCLPWLDYTSLDNALPGSEDCIPRIGWGKFVQAQDGSWDMAMTLEVHHALIDGAHAGAFFIAVQEALNSL